MSSSGGMARLGPVDELDLRPVFQPIVDLRDRSVVGYEALMRGGNGDGVMRSAQDLLDAARREDSVAALDLAARDAALKAADDRGLEPPFSLFLNVDADTLDARLPELPPNHRTHLIEVTEEALIARPEAMLRALTELRSAGWGIVLDDVGADSRSLALMPVLYPDVIKLDLRLLADREARDVARVVTAVAAEAEARHATLLAEGIDAEEQLALARAYGATLGQGYLLGAPEQLPEQLPPAGRALRLPGAGGDPFGPTPWERVTNWQRPTRGPWSLGAQIVRVILQRAADLGETAMVLVSLADEKYGEDSVKQFGWVRDHVAFIGILNMGRPPERPGIRSGTLAPDDPLRGTGTLVALAPGFSACFVVRDSGDGRTWEFATTYDRDTVVECALPLMARMEPLNQR